MSLILKNTCVGLDCEIKRAQRLLWDILNPVWDNPDWQSYPRVYKNKNIDENGQEYNKPEFTDELKDYSETLFDDRFDAVSFFLEGDVVTVDKRVHQSQVSFIFSCHLSGLYPDTTREDMKLRNDITNVLYMLNSNWSFVGVKTGVDEVYKEFRRKGLLFSNIGNRYLVRFDFKVYWDFSC